MRKIILCRGIQGSGKTTFAKQWVLEDPEHKENILNPQDDFKYELEFKNFFIPLQDCIERDSKRPNPIGEEAIRKTYEKYKDILKV